MRCNDRHINGAAVVDVSVAHMWPQVAKNEQMAKENRLNRIHNYYLSSLSDRNVLIIFLSKANLIIILRYSMA